MKLVIHSYGLVAAVVFAVSYAQYNYDYSPKFSWLSEFRYGLPRSPLPEIGRWQYPYVMGGENDISIGNGNPFWSWKSPVEWVCDQVFRSSPRMTSYIPSMCEPEPTSTVQTIPEPLIEPSRIQPYPSTTASSANGCVLPEQSIGSYYEVTCAGLCATAPGAKVPVKTTLHYKCKKGYALKGKNTSICSVFNTWSERPSCVKLCAALHSESVDITCRYKKKIVSCKSKMMPGTKATLGCKSSYKLPPASYPWNKMIYCMKSGEWDHPVFRCDLECGKGLSDGSPLIVSGSTATRGVAPWHVAIYEISTLGSYEQICGGSLISSKLVISAAHCFYDDNLGTTEAASKFIVAAGKHNRSYNSVEPSRQESTVESINVMERYSGNSGNQVQDIAIVRVRIPFDMNAFVSPICIDWENFYERDHLQPGAIGKVVGWGITAQGIPSEELQEIDMPFVSYRQCISAVPRDFKSFVTPDKFCAGYLNGSSVCNGDSGGGLSFLLGEEWYLRGIVSVSPTNGSMCDNRYYTAFTNVGHFRDWIQDAFLVSN